MGKHSKITPAMKNALCAGEFLPFDGSTYLKLCSLGLLQTEAPNRISATEAGRALASTLPEYWT